MKFNLKNKSKAKKSKRASKPVVAQVVKKEMQAQINKNMETKYAYTNTGDTLVKFNSGITSTGDYMRIVPNIGQGDGDNQRDGDQIRALSLKIRGYVKLDINNTAPMSTNSAVVVRLMVLSQKNKSNFTDLQLSSSGLATLLKKGGTTVGFTGLLSDLYAPINTDVFTKHHDELIYLYQDAIISPNGAATPGIQYITSNIKNTVKFININVPCKNKVLKYDEDIAGTLEPTNFAPFLVLGYSYLDGTIPDVINSKVGLCYDSIMTFKEL